MFIYFGILSLSTAFGYLSEVLKNRLFWLISLLLVVIFAGFRYYVGIDYESYTFIFSSLADASTEPGFRLLNFIVFILKLNVQLVFFTSSLITFAFFYKGIKRLSDDIPLSLFVLLFCGFFIESLNIIRQYIAISIFFYSVQYIVARNLKKYLLYILLATFFHYSAVLLIFAYYALGLNVGRTWYIVLLLGFLLPFIIPIKAVFALIPGYSVYFDVAADANGSAQLGLGFLSKLLIGFACISYYDNIIEKTENAKIYLNGFFLYLFLLSFFRDFMVMVRLGYYFNIFLVLLIPCFMKVFDKNARKVIVVLFIGYGLLLLTINLLDTQAKLVPYNYLFQLKD